MSEMPLCVREYLRDNVTERFFPACLEVDYQHRLLAKFGDVDFYHLNQLSLGCELEEHLPWLIGMNFTGDAIVLPLLRVADGRCCNIHLLPATRSSFYLLLLDASLEHDNIEVYQQKSNEVQLLNTRLKKVLAELNQAQHELREKNQQIAQVSLLKSQFIANISHEFRTPLTSILGYIEMFEQNKIGDAELGQMLTAIGAGAQHVLSLVDNVLDYARFEAGELSANAHSCHLDRLFADICAIFLPLATDKKLNFVFSCEPQCLAYVKVDAVRLRQVVINLCANAIKYTDKGEVALAVSLDDELLRIKISDTGAGIPVAAQERIFLPFRRLDRDRLSRGAGLGLAITQQILEMLGGGLTLDSKPGVGSVFRVTIPVQRQQQTDHTVSGSAYKLLVAEDDPDARNIMQLYLQSAGYSVEFVNDGRAAVETALKTKPDLILMDMFMPVLDGISATVQLRSEGFMAPIIMLSAAVSRSDKTHAMNAGCDGYLQKPLKSDMLLAELAQYLQQKHE